MHIPLYKKYVIALLCIVAVVGTCTNYENPFTDSRNALIYLALKDSKDHIDTNCTVRDTIGNTIQIGVCPFLYDLIDSIAVTVQKYKNGNDSCVILKKLSSNTDTVWQKFTFTTAGIYSVSAKANMQAGRQYSLNGTITIFKKNISATVSPLLDTKAIDSVATFSVAAIGDAPFTYQWFHGTTLLSGKTGVSLVLPKVALRDSGNYRCLVADKWLDTVTTEIAQLLVTGKDTGKVVPVSKPPQPQAQSVSTKMNVALTITLSAISPDGSSIKSWSLDTQTTHGTATLTNSSLPVVVYTPKTGFLGTDFFTFKATAGNLTSTSSARVSIKVDTTNIAPAPNLTFPSDFASNVAVNPTLVWEPVSGASIYQLQISESDNFSTLFTNDTNLITISKEINGLANNRKYFWRVRVKNLGNVGNWAVRSFSTVKKKYRITVNAENGVVFKLPDSLAYDSGSVVVLKPSPKLGYQFVNWTGDITGTSDTFVIAMNGEKNITANFGLKNVTITFKYQDARSNTLQSVLWGSKIKSPSDTTRPNFFFIGWYLDSSGTTKWSFDWTVTSDDTLFAKWASLKDQDGNVYSTIKIGTQTWMAENLRTTKYNDGTVIPAITDATIWGSLTTPGYCFYANTMIADSIQHFGALYNWYTVETKKLAPLGWHVPTSNDWDTLLTYLVNNRYNWDGSTSSNKIAKSLAMVNDWISDSIQGTIGSDLTQNNKSGFSAFPSGYRIYDGDFRGRGLDASWWSSTQKTTSQANYCNITNESDSLSTTFSVSKTFGLSVRLIKD